MSKEIEIINLQGKKQEKVKTPFWLSIPANNQLLFQTVNYYQSLQNSASAHAKRRGEVSGGGKKPWKQKGTGRARQGSTRAPQWVHGGKIHTPRPRKYTQHMPLKMRRAALRSALAAKAAEAGLVVVDELVLPEPKTRLMAEALNILVGDATVLILAAEKGAAYDVVARSTNNLPDARLLIANYLNIRDLLGYDKLVMPLKALDVLKSFLA